MSEINSIPKEFIQKYLDRLFEAAKSIGPDTLMGMACVKRAEVIMDLVEAYKQSIVKISKD